MLTQHVKTASAEQMEETNKKVQRLRGRRSKALWSAQHVKTASAEQMEETNKKVQRLRGRRSKALWSAQGMLEHKRQHGHPMQLRKSPGVTTFHATGPRLPTPREWDCLCALTFPLKSPSRTSVFVHKNAQRQSSSSVTERLLLFGNTP